MNETEMQVELRNGSLFHVLGADQPDRLRGLNLFGVCFDEYAVTDSSQPWDLVRPILAENGGWVCFLSTPNGRNHFWTLYQQARESPDWFTTLKSIDDTRRDAPGEDGRPIVTRAQVAEEIRAGMPEAFARQEFDVSFLAATPGAYYATEMERVEREGPIRLLPWTPALPVTTSWDLGIDDATAIVFAQMTGLEVRVIDYYEARGQGLAHYAKVLHEKPYRYHEHLLPHDVEVTELGSGMTRLEILRTLNVRPCRVLSARKLEDGISAVRHLLPRCYFDRDKCRLLLRALEAYHADWKAERQAQGLRPVHDWSSHGADAFRYLAHGLPAGTLTPRPRVTVPLVQYSWTTPARRVGGAGPGSERL
jgi:phage terminase large subunit